MTTDYDTPGVILKQNHSISMNIYRLLKLNNNSLQFFNNAILMKHE